MIHIALFEAQLPTVVNGTVLMYFKQIHRLHIDALRENYYVDTIESFYLPHMRDILKWMCIHIDMKHKPEYLTLINTTYKQMKELVEEMLHEVQMHVDYLKANEI